MVTNHHIYRGKLKFERTVQERYQQLMDFITIGVINIGQQQYPYHYIIYIPMTAMINIYLNKHPMSWELIHCRILHPSDSVMKVMCCHQTLNGISKHCHKKLNKLPCKI